MTSSARIRRLGLVSALCFMVVGGPGAATVSGASALPMSCEWAERFTPNGPVGNSNHLFGTSALSPTDVWAVGKSYPSDGGQSVPLIEHWDGVSWELDDSSLPPGTSLQAVDAVAPSDVWAVGYFTGALNNYRPVAAHWNGSAWRLAVVPSPRGDAYLLGVKALASNDVWAVGWRRNSTSDQKTLVEHWDGTAWSVVPSVDVSEDQAFAAVSATSPTDVWAVGWHVGERGINPLIEHWDGSAWRPVASDDRGDSIELTGVEAISPDDAWAVGSAGKGGSSGAYVERWDGSRWTQVVEPRARGGLNAVSAGSSDDVWMVGNGRLDFLLTEHWDGASLRLVEDAGNGEDNLHSVDVLPSGEAWAVGEYFSDSGHYLTEAFHLTCRS